MANLKNKSLAELLKEVLEALPTTQVLDDLEPAPEESWGTRRTSVTLNFAMFRALRTAVERTLAAEPPTTSLCTVTPMSEDEQRAWNQAVLASAATLDPDIVSVTEALVLVERNEKASVRGFSGVQRPSGVSSVGLSLRTELKTLQDRKNAIAALLLPE